MPKEPPLGLAVMATGHPPLVRVNDWLAVTTSEIVYV